MTHTFHRLATLTAVAALTAFAGLPAAQAQTLDPKNRVELKRGPLTGTNMEVIISTAEYKPGDTVPRHIHHGEEAVYVLQGGVVETADGKRITMTTGAGSINVRDVVHGGFKVVGDTPLKLVTVHIVDKGAPLYDAPGK